MKKLLSLVLVMTLVLSLTTTVNAAESEETETSTDTAVTETERSCGRFDGQSAERSEYHDFHDELPEDFEGRKKDSRPDLSEVLADYPDELAEIEAIFDAIIAGDITREEAHEAMNAYADLLAERTEHFTFEKELPEDFQGENTGRHNLSEQTTLKGGKGQRPEL